MIRNGYISKEEFMSLCQVAFRRELDEEKVDEIFGYLDENQTQNIVNSYLKNSHKVIDFRRLFFDCRAYGRYKESKETLYN